MTAFSRMVPSSHPNIPGHQGPYSAWHSAESVFLALIFLLALLTRLYGLADFITTDEAYHWMTRTEHFYAGLLSGHWADTFQTGHPGVSLMWLGSASLALEQAFGEPENAATRLPALLTHLAWLRTIPALFEAVLVPVAYVLLRLLIRRPAALCASLLWACSPYLIAHSRLLHLDALLSSCVTMSVLCMLCRYAYPRRGMLFLFVSAVFAGLALLTKGPALILLPAIGVLMFWAIWLTGRAQLANPGQAFQPVWLAQILWRAVRLYCLWLVLALCVVFALWPALWVEPGHALGRYLGEITDNGGRPNGDGQFFLGQAVADPGWAFYLLADLFRSTPATLFGWLFALLALLGSQAGLLKLGKPEGQQRLSMQNEHSFSSNHVLLALAAFALFWTVVMTLGPKKFDRYVLPSWPTLLILAGAGWAWLFQKLWVTRHRIQRIGFLIIACVALLSEIGQLAYYHPYYLSYYNPLLGGGKTAQKLFLIGWGEGMDQVGAYLAGRPDLQYGPVLSALGPTLQPFVPVDVRDVEDFGKIPANYAVVYLESIQRAANPDIYAALQTTQPVYIVRIHGIEYARIYQLPRPFAQPSDVQFGDALRLRGFSLDTTAAGLLFTPAWDVRAQPDTDYRVFVHLLNQQGKRVSQIDVSPGGGEAPSTRTWQSGQQFAVPLPMALPADLAPGRYQLVMGVYATETGTRLAFQGGTPADPALAGDHAILLTSLSLP